MNLRAERVLDSADELGECPIWDERMGTLWWIDIHGRAIKRYDGDNLRVLSMPEKPGSIAFRLGTHQSRRGREPPHGRDQRAAAATSGP